MLAKHALAVALGFALGGVLVAGCFYKAGVLATDGDAGASSGPKSFGASGHDERFEWSETQVVDHERGIVWQRRATERLDWAAATRACQTWGGTLPSREDLLAISELLGDTDLFSAPGPASEWHWSSTAGSREGTQWAVGGSSYANANDAHASAVVRCMRPIE
jgi:hypothetical protein